jgi:hypothetical protein
MKPSVLAAIVALALALAPLAALAQGADAPQPAAAVAAPAPPAVPTAPWSLGAGVGWSIYGSQYLVLGSLGGPLIPPMAPTVHASLERAVGTGWWLELGFAGTVLRRRGEAPAGSGRTTRDDLGTAALTLGVRRALTRPGAPVCVSVDLALVAGYTASRVEWAALTTPQIVRGEALSLGLAAGLAVERELTPGLSLRVGTSLLDASWSTASAEDSVFGEATRKGGSASLTLSPWLELRQAF